MTMSDRDQLIRTALTPRADLVVPADLGDLIHAQLLETPQRRRPLVAPVLRRLPDLPVLARPAAIWLTALLLLGLAVIALLAIGARRDPPFASAVTTYHGTPAQDGTMPGPGPAGNARALFDVALPGTMDNLGLALVSDGLAYFADLRGHVSALSGDDLSQVWRVDDLEHGSHAPVLLGSNLIVAGEDGTVVALDAKTGETRWTRSLGIDVYAPLTGTEDVVLVSSGDGVVVALSATDGSERYRVDAGGQVKRSPAVADGRVYVASDNGLVTAFDLGGRTPVWHVDLAEDDSAPLNRPEVSSPIYANGVVYVARGPFDVSSPSPHEIVAIDADTQEVRWRWPSPTYDRMFVGAVTTDAVYTVGEDGAVRVLDPVTGHPASPSPLLVAGGGIGALPAVVGDTLYVSSYDGVVQAIDRHTGALAWAVEVNGQPTQLAVVDGRVYLGTSLGRAVVIGTP